jgi:hypothetical protein
MLYAATFAAYTYCWYRRQSGSWMLRSRQQVIVKLVIMMMNGRMIQLIAVVAAVESKMEARIMKKVRAAVVTSASSSAC